MHKTLPLGLRIPSFSAALIMYKAGRSYAEIVTKIVGNFHQFTLTLPPTLINSAFPRISHPVASLTVLIRMRGVLLIAPLTPCLTSISPLQASTSRKSNKTVPHQLQKKQGQGCFLDTFGFLDWRPRAFDTESKTYERCYTPSFFSCFRSVSGRLLPSESRQH